MSSSPKSKKASNSAARRHDGAGHMDPAHAERLLDMARSSRDGGPDVAFFAGPQSGDDWAEELGEAAVEAMTMGEDQLATELEEIVPEELGGPFVQTSASTEFADGTDESNVADATREPFPTT